MMMFSSSKTAVKGSVSMELCDLHTTLSVRKRSRKSTTNAIIFENIARLWKYTMPSEYNENIVMNTELCEAVLKRDIERVRKILMNERCLDINYLDENGMSALHYAAKYGYLESACLLVASSAAIDLRTRRGSTALHIATRHRQVQVAGFLLKQGSNPNLVDENGLNALLLAAKKGLSDIVEKIFQINAMDPNIQSAKLSTALHFAAIINDCVTCELLLENGACVDRINLDGETPLHLAVGEGNIEIIKVLFDSIDERKDSPLTVCDYINRRRIDSKTALHLAAQKGNLIITSILMKNGADITAMTSDSSSVLHFAAAAGNGDVVKRFLSEGLQIDLRDQENRTALHRALTSGQMETAKVLLSHGADVNAKDDQGRTPLLLAVMNEQIEVIPILLHLGASPAMQDINLKNSLHHAAENGNMEAAKLLIEVAKRSLHDVDENNSSPLHYAARYGNANILKMFMAETMQLDVTDVNGNTPLHVAAQFGNVSCIELLTKSDLIGLANYVTPEQQTPLHVAVINKQVEACRVLLKAAVDVNCQDNHKWTPLHYAATQDNDVILLMLLEEHANINLQDSFGLTPLMVAAEIGNIECVMSLLESGADVLPCDLDGNNFFDIAIDSHKAEICKAVLESDRWAEVLSSKDKHGQSFMVKLIELHPDLAEIVLDRSTTFSDHNPEHPELAVTYDYMFLEEAPDTVSVLTDTASIIKNKRNDLFFAPKLMAQFERERLMAHPITMSLFRLKWGRLCRYVYYLSFFIYLIFVVSLSVLVIFSAKTYVSVIVKRAELNITLNSNSTEMRKIFAKLPFSNRFGQFMGCFILGFSFLQIAKEFVQLGVMGWKYFINFTNYLEIILYLSTIYFTFKFVIDQTADGKLYEVGIICVFVGWVNTLLFLQRIPLYRLYIVMFLRVCCTILKLFLVFAIIILAFAVTFYLLFIRQKAFQALPISWLKVMVMVTGEFEFDELIVSKVGLVDSAKYPYVPFPYLSYAVFVIFVFLVAVAFTNLLVGLAVGDIDSVRKFATVSIFQQQLEFIDTLQGITPKYFLSKFVYVENSTVFINRKTRLERLMSTITSDTTIDDLKRLKTKQTEFETKRMNGMVAKGNDKIKSSFEEIFQKQRTNLTTEFMSDATVICNKKGTL